MKENKSGITLIALIITIIVMLILVAVTVKIGNDQGLFSKAREAKSGTAYSAEEENLAMYMYGEGVYDATTGEIDLIKLKDNLEKSGEWGEATIAGTKLTVLGKQSGQQHIINADGTMGEKKDGDSSDIVGNYYFVVGDELGSYAQFKEDGSIKVVYLSSDGTFEEETYSTFSYDYTPATKKGCMSVIYEGETKITINFDYEIIFDENGNEVNSVIIFNGDSLEFNWIMKNHSKGVTPLNGNTYVNGNKTIEFTTSVVNGETYGWCSVKENGTVVNSGEGNYICLNRKIITANSQLRESEITVNSDYSELTVTENGISTVYTKQ